MDHMCMVACIYRVKYCCIAESISVQYGRYLCNRQQCCVTQYCLINSVRYVPFLWTVEQSSTCTQAWYPPTELPEQLQELERTIAVDYGVCHRNT